MIDNYSGIDDNYGRAAAFAFRSKTDKTTRLTFLLVVRYSYHTREVTMSLEQIQAVVLDVLKEVQQISGRSWVDLSPTATPLNTLDGFDSLCSVEATVMVEERLGCGELKVCSLFISEDGTRPLSVLEIAQRITTLIAAPRGKK